MPEAPSWLDSIRTQYLEVTEELKLLMGPEEIKLGKDGDSRPKGPRQKGERTNLRELVKYKYRRKAG